MNHLCKYKVFFLNVNNVELIFLLCYRMATIVTTEIEVGKSPPDEAGKTSATSDPTPGSDATNISGFNKSDRILRTPAQRVPSASKNSLGAISKHPTTTSAASTTASLFAAATSAVGAAKAAKKELHFMSAALGTSSKEHNAVVDNLNEEWRRNPVSGATSSLPGSLKNFTIPKVNLYPSLNPNVNPNLPMNYEVEEMDDTLNSEIDNARHPDGNLCRPLSGEMTINEEALAKNQAKADEPETEKPISDDDSNLFYPVAGRTDPIGWDQNDPTTRIKTHKRTRRSLAHLDLGAYSDGEVNERHHWTGRETGTKGLYKRRKTPNWPNSNPGDDPPASTTQKRPYPLQPADRRYQYTSTRSGGPGGSDGREPPSHPGKPPGDAAGAGGPRDPGGPGDPNGYGNGNGDPPSSDPSGSDDDDLGLPPARKRHKNAATSEAWARIEMAKCIPASLCVLPNLHSVHDVGELKL